MVHITESQFKSLFSSLVKGGGSLPKKTEDQYILFLSAILALEPLRQYSEAELNESLKPWSTNFGKSFGLDHVTLRRYLIDGKLIARDQAGGAYALNTDEMPITFDISIAEIDVKMLIEDARREREERKQLNMHSAKK
jgi:hypothetical protein